MSVVDAFSRDLVTGKPAIGRMVTIVALSSLGSSYAVLKLYGIATTAFGAARLPDPLPVHLAFVGLAIFLLILLALLALVGFWQLHSFSKTVGNFIERGGELKKGTESNIALRVETFKQMIEALAIDTPQRELNKRFTAIGKLAGRSFAEKISKIHDDQVRTGRAWAQLDDDERLNWWTGYDRSAGLGEISVIRRGANVYVQIRHDELFAEPTPTSKSAEAIAYLLSGYCETVLNGIMRSSTVALEADSVEIEPKRVTYLFSRRSTAETRVELGNVSTQSRRREIR